MLCRIVEACPSKALTSGASFIRFGRAPATVTMCPVLGMFALVWCVILVSGEMRRVGFALRLEPESGTRRPVFEGL